MNDWLNIDKQFPYNPNDVDIRQQQFPVFHLLKMIEHHRIELWREEYYQRKGNSWNKAQMSRLIESIIMRIPLPIFYFDGSDEPWKVIDGLNRLNTLYSYIFEKTWGLEGLEFMTDFTGYKFSDLPYQYQRAIEETVLQAYIINPGTPNRVKLNIFQRINTGGKSLSNQEVRNAYYSGISREFISKLASSKAFLDATQGKVPTSRMRDKEVILRFVAFYQFLERYGTPMEGFLDFAMEQIESMNDLETVEIQFEKSMKLCSQIFGDKAFFILDRNKNKTGSKINVALFETLSVNFALLSDDDAKKLLNMQKRVFSHFVMLFHDIDFHKSISSSTSSKKAVYTRFGEVNNLLNFLLK
ncbi:DUF262 domain-containing protein [Chryseobacterium sp. WG23]|uniref:DUF262 domain-containing protein n=1 Tax=Chryseobacterium sp. WG23 TaxID=2926910 RepID=UPI00211E6870|nr:DUF262 domain-containing protein [Chryseobacterium sp. WG23]MCQ9634194.1 DUF262 domain-containing protein [Chryseobacterium sp. WG23]